MTKMRKISISIPASLVDDLDYLSARTGTSRSAIISEFLAEGATHTRRMLELIPSNPTPADIVRMRGQSEDVVRARLGQLRGMADDLFSE